MNIRKKALLAIAASLVCSTVAEAKVTSNFGFRSDPFHGRAKFHAGMDMSGRVGMPIYATGDGVVVRSRWAGGYGNLVEIDHGFGYVSRFGHLSKSLVQEGQFVRRGQMVALMGSTGHSTGPHLHYEVRVGGSAVDPSRYMQIVFSRQPDWNAVRQGAYSVPRQRTATLAMAVASPRRAPRRIEDLRKVADLEIDYGSGVVSRGIAKVATSVGFGSGHVSFSK
jgi:hypothetical protein